MASKKTIRSTDFAKLAELLQRVSPLDVKKEEFRRGVFDFIVRRSQDGRKRDLWHKKQELALQKLMDEVTEELLYGGAAGGAKSWTGATWLLFMCLLFPDTNWFIGREELKRITESTLKTFFKVCREYGVDDTLYKYNAQKFFIKFSNGSNIDLLELKYKPSDPEYERYGSTEYTGGWIDEVSEVDFGAYDVLRTRIGRNMNDHYGIIGKIFCTCNPTKKWPKRYFYDPWKKESLPEYMDFIPSLVTDNPFREKGYVEKLKRTADKAKKERLLHGNWEYDDNPDQLCDHDSILAIFGGNDHLKPGKRYITADVARLGSDKAIILVWDDWTVIDYAAFGISLITEIQDKINEFRRKWQIPKRHVIVDQDGVGGGVVDNCGVKGFVNNSRPVRVEMPAGMVMPNYNNLQTQCGYYLAKKINESGINVKCYLKDAFQEEMIEELGQLQSWRADDDRKVYLLPKKEIKKNIGRSPDWRDALLMRSYFDLKPADRYFIVGL